MNDQDILNLRQKRLLPTANHYYKEPLHPVRAKGCEVWDKDGKRYLDACGGILCISVGHNHPKIKTALKKLLDDDHIQHISVLYLSEFLPQLIDALVEEAPEGIDKGFLVNSGSEANELAVMAARHFTGHQTVIALRHAYHGGTSVPLALCGHGTWKFDAAPNVGVTHAKAPDCYRCPFGQTKETCSAQCADDVEDVIKTTTNGKIAAFISEPIMGVGGFIDPPAKYHQKVHDIVKKYGGLYISDEVQTGVGRAGSEFFAIVEHGVKADIVTMAKGLGNGAPVGATLMRGDVAEAMRGRLYFNTFGGDPYQALQALLTVQIVKEEHLIANAKKHGETLLNRFRELQAKIPSLGDVRGRGLMIGLELVKDKATKEPNADAVLKVMELTRDKGLLIGKGGLYGNVVRLAPPLSITDAQIEELGKTMEAALLALS
jgi:4-aminobutyrate aminotransferase-like enzyme